MKQYEFTMEEAVILREALANYKHLLSQGDNPSERRMKNYMVCESLHSQIKDDIRLDCVYPMFK